jgi:fibronectin-binding autotransporter adhesin
MATYTLGQGQAAMNTISGQNYSGFGTANVGGGVMFMNAFAQQLSAARTGRGEVNRIALAEACEPVASETCDGERRSPWSLWGTAMGGLATVAGNTNAGGLTYNAGGFATGVDYRVNPSLLLGGGVGFASGNQWVGGFSGQGSTNSYQASLFASFTPGAFYLDALAGYGYNDNQMTRQIVLPNLAARTALGRTGANQLLGQVEAGYRIGLLERAAATLTPFARLQATSINQAGFSESGAQSLSLTVASQTTSSVRSVLGAELAGDIDMGWAEKLALLLRLGWAHEYADTARPTTAALAGAPGQNFTVYGAAPQRDAVTLGFGVSTAVAAGATLFLRYAGEFSTGSSANSLTGGFRMTW